MESKTNIVLVHGAWADGSSWGKVIPFLQQKGFNVAAAQIPLTSLADDIVVTRNLLAAQKGPTVLAGHSYAGVVISGAANDAPNVKALVYIAAFGLDEGESIDALSKQGPAPAGAAAVRPPDEHCLLWIDRDGFAKAFAADADPVEARVMAAVQKPLSINARRIASFDRRAVSAAKNLVNQVSLPSADRLLDALNSFQTALTWPEAQQRIQALLERGLQREGDFELRWPQVLGTLLET